MLGHEMLLRAGQLPCFASEQVLASALYVWVIGTVGLHAYARTAKSRPMPYYCAMP